MATHFRTVGLLVASAAALGGCDGCYGLAGLSVEGDRAPAAVPADSFEPSAPLVPGKPQLRLLNGVEYRNTVRDLLGVEAFVAMGELTSGYDTGSGARVDENTLSALMVEGERAGAEYVTTRIAADFNCFNRADVTDGCVGQIITELGARAYRRPLTRAQHETLSAYFAALASDSGDRVLATEFLVARLLTAPQFLYRAEVGVPLLNAGTGSRGLDSFDRATLISYALTASMPDAALMKDAAAGLLSSDRVREHVRRLLATPAAKARLVTFFKQWLRVGALDAMAADATKFPKLQSAEQGVALRSEFDAFVTAAVFGPDGTLPGLFKDNSTFLNRHTAPLYGLTSQSDELSQVWLEPTQRKGILTLASVLSAHASIADPTADRPVRRGLLVLNRVLCGEVGPPSGINTAAASSAASSQVANFDELTVREQYEAMMEQGSQCKSCHQQFMPLGFAFGQFDALGRHVTARGTRPIVTAVSDVPISGQPKSFSGATALIDELAELPAASSCFTKNFVTFTVGTPTGAHVDALTAELSSSFAKSGFRIAQLIEDTLASPHLYVRRSE